MLVNISILYVCSPKIRATVDYYKKKIYRQIKLKTKEREKCILESNP